jgi:hypothetical protein
MSSKFELKELQKKQPKRKKIKNSFKFLRNIPVKLTLD